MNASPSFKAVVDEGVALQRHLADAELVTVGGTAVALHCRHRYSLDVDFVTPRLRGDYQGVLDRWESWAGWQTNRRNPPVLILGERHGVELGIRQLRHRDRLETTEVEGCRIPTATEMLRMKAFLLNERRTTRDYLDVAALSELLGLAAAAQALRELSNLYPPCGQQSAATAFAEACEAEPADLAQVDLRGYRGIIEPLTDWEHVSTVVRQLGHAVIKQELSANPRPSAP